jgi:demethylmenaquinone methyltransferase/2-methoxy-6-polyprenyl-1,4-benzoquinol methylase
MALEPSAPAEQASVAAVYRRRARWYDITANLYYLIGFREQAFRREAVAALHLEPGDTVVELGCGTGLNFPLLEDAVGPEGQIVGVDLTPEMLEVAEERVRRSGWRNVELVNADAASFRFPERVDGVISTFAITLVPGYDAAIRNAASALSPGSRLVILDLKRPAWAPDWLFRLGVRIESPFGVRAELANRRPWESVERYLKEVAVSDLYWGFAYIAAGETPRAAQREEDPR